MLRAAYIWQYASDVAFREPFDKAALKKRLNELIKDMLILAKSHKFDVMNGLSSLDNGFFLEEQKFGPGDGQVSSWLLPTRVVFGRRLTLHYVFSFSTTFLTTEQHLSQVALMPGTT